MINVCERCGKHFIARVFAKWCLECRPIAYREAKSRYNAERLEQRRTYSRQYYAEHREAYIERAKRAYRE